MSYHFSAKVYTRMALVDLSGSKQIINLKPAVQMYIGWKMGAKSAKG